MQPPQAPADIPSPGDPPHSVLKFSADGAEGWLVVDTLRDGLAFGGFRFSPAVTEAEVRGLARAMTWKLAGHGLPTGGAKGGLRCDPSDPRLGDWLRAFVAQCGEPLRRVAVVGKDMGATDALLDRLYAELGRAQLALIRPRAGGRACPERLRDLSGYVPHMTGRGVAWAAAAALSGDIAGRRVAIQGAGAVGVGAAVRLAELGAETVAISDARGTLAAPPGGALPVEGLVRAAGPGGLIDRGRCDFAHVAAPRDALLSAEADVLVLAASSHSVDEALAAGVRAPLVVEGSNFGLTEGAREALAARGVAVIPDVIASSSSAAMVCHQLATGNAWPADALWATIRGAIERSVALGLEGARRDGVTVREAYLRRFAGGRGGERSNP
ncbi:MAG TPA: Glu/Leu/Phe/Val dehydrogenase dimerization domain-containing protein [Polyangiaceae bacterium]|nr:Glu/Leu/Phe/Val dehydrogenase dimerization domain-containing protein [Polyangiaceae bacterium]